MRLPNGYGSVFKYSGPRRNPYVARKTIGYKDNGQPVYKVIGYFPNKTAALQALAEFNRDPFAFGNAELTLQKLYDMWSDYKYDKLADSTVRSYTAAWAALYPLRDKKVLSLRLAEYQTFFDNSDKSKVIKQVMKIVLGQMYRFAIKRELIPPDRKDIISYIELNGTAKKRPHTVFTEAEISKLWEMSESSDVQIVLILLYTGLRIGELLDLKIEDVNLEEKWLYVRKAKTPAGVRYVPISSRIYPFLAKFCAQSDFYVLGGISYDHVKRYCFRPLSAHGMEHTAHDARHTFISRLVNARADDRVIKQIVGHAGSDITESVYTHVGMEEKRMAVELLK